MSSLRFAFAAILAVLAAACAQLPDEPQARSQRGAGDWYEVPLPGKLSTRYFWTEKDGRPALAAESNRSASMYRRRVRVEPSALGDASFSWWAQDLVPGATVTEADRSDAPVRVLFGFEGDVSKLSMRTRAAFELAEALSGEKPPYATLMYTWDPAAEPGSLWINGRTDRVRKIVLDSGPAQLRRWRDHRRNLAADFRRAFGEDPGALISIAVMTDSDNTASEAKAWYGPIVLH